MTTPVWSCASTREALGAYALGLLDEGERELTDLHLEECDACRRELERLSSLPSLLSLVAPEDISQLAAGGDRSGGDDGRKLASLVAARIRKRTRLRGMAAAAAAVIVLVAAALTGVGLSGSHAPASEAISPPAAWLTARTTSTLGDVKATVRYSKESWGMAVDVMVTGLPQGIMCQLWVTDPQGVHIAAGGWLVKGDEAQTWYPGSTWIQASQARGLDVTTGPAQHLVQLATFSVG